MKKKRGVKKGTKYTKVGRMDEKEEDVIVRRKEEKEVKEIKKKCEAKFKLLLYSNVQCVACE